MSINSSEPDTTHLIEPVSATTSVSPGKLVQFITSLLGRANNTQPPELWQQQGNALYQTSRTFQQPQPRCLPSARQAVSDAVLGVLGGASQIAQNLTMSFLPSVEKINSELDLGANPLIRRPRAVPLASLPAEPLCEHPLDVDVPPPAPMIDTRSGDMLTELNAAVDTMLSQHNCVESDTALSLERLLSTAILFSERNTLSRQELVRTLQGVKNAYGELPDEALSELHQQSIIRDWVTRNIYGNNLVNFLIAKISQHLQQYGVEAEPYNGHDMERDLRSQLTKHYKTTGQDKITFDWIWSNVVLHELPILQFEGSLKALTIDALEWGQINAGLCFAQRIGQDMSAFSLSDALQTGMILLEQIKQGVVPPVEFFRLPTMLRYAQHFPKMAEYNPHNRQEAMAFEGQALHSYFVAHNELITANDPIAAYNRALQSYQSRSAMAKQYIDDRCPGMEVNTYLNLKEGFCRQSLHSRPYSDPEYLSNIDEKYDAMLDRITSAYFDLDAPLVVSAWLALDNSELDFIKAATVKRVSIQRSAADEVNYTTSRGNPHAIAGLTIKQAHNVELFAAQYGNRSERIYALCNENNTYSIQRVDRDESRYQTLFENKIPLNKTQYKLVISIYGEPLKLAGADLTPMCNSISQHHKKQLRKALYDHGYDKTPLQKVKEFGLSLIPFYICINEAQAGNVGGALFACSIDVLILLPVAGSLMHLTSGAVYIVGGGGMQMRAVIANGLILNHSIKNIVKDGGLALLRNTYPHLIKTATSELPALSLATLRAIDPGVELIGILSKKSAQGVIAMGNKMVGWMPKAKHVWQMLANRVEKMPDRLLPMSHALFSAHKQEKIPVIAYSTAQSAGRQYLEQQYVQVSQVSGEPFGRKMVLRGNQLIFAKRIYNLQTQGLGGKGAPEQGQIWAKKAEELVPQRPVERSNPAGVGEVNVDAGPSSVVKATEMLDQNLLAELVKWKTLPHSAEEMREEVVKLIQRCIEAKSSHLDISGYSLKSTPPVLPGHIIKLSLSNNKLRTLPDNLPQSLRILDAHNNALISLPELPQLHVLDVSFNKLTNIENALPVTLKSLKLLDNQLTVLPLTHIDDLQFLDASYNNLKQISEPLPKNLKTLFLAYNDLSQLPRKWPEKLQELHLEHNQLTVLDESIGDLSHRANVQVTNNPLSREMSAILQDPPLDSRFFNHKIKYTETTVPFSKHNIDHILRPDHPIAPPSDASKRPVESIISDANVGAGTSRGSAGVENAAKRFKPDTGEGVITPQDALMASSNVPDIIKHVHLKYPFVSKEWLTWANVKLTNQIAKRDRIKAMWMMFDAAKNDKRVINFTGLNLDDLPAKLPPLTEHVILKNARFKTIPTSWPTTIKKIDLSVSSFDKLPGKWPDSLESLILTNTKIKTIQELNLPPSLKDLDVSWTDIKELFPLPHNLVKVRADGCPLNSQGVKWGQLPKEIEFLSLKQCGLTRIPITFPKQLKTLNLEGNFLSAIDISAPELTSLDLSKQSAGNSRSYKGTGTVHINRMDTPNLNKLNLNENILPRYPNEWPPKLKFLHMQHVRQSTFPTHLPTSVTLLDLTLNEITTLPANFMTLPRNMKIILQDNLLNHETLKTLITRQYAEKIEGPIVEYDKPVWLRDVIALWFDSAQGMRWRGLDNVEEAFDFSEFLHRLFATRSAIEVPEFRQQIYHWLEQLPDDRDLVQKTFEIAHDATRTCQDRVTCTFNNMQTVLTVSKVEKGFYNNELNKLVDIGREMFRLEQLEKIARTKPLRLHANNEIEVYLAFQIKLRESLRLTTVAPKMKFGHLTDLTEMDFTEALIKVKQLENDNFPTWFSQWSPWKKTLQRSDPQRYSDALEKRETFVAEGAYEERVKEELERLSLVGDLDSEREIGKKVMDEFDDKLYIGLTEHVLGQHKLRHLLQNVW